MDKLPPLAVEIPIPASAEKLERIKAALAGPADDEDNASEFEVRSQIHEHYIEYAQRHDLRLDLDSLEPKDRINLMAKPTRLHAAIKGNYGIKSAIPFDMVQLELHIFLGSRICKYNWTRRW